ncbi:MAG: DUF3782 domain-containing protein [Leptospiraceae bacterium]|nr:DUF3782 domain-containing protein [Leptospiraceae bacterium]
MGLPNYIVQQFPAEIQTPITVLGEWMSENSVKREDFKELKNTVASIAKSVQELAEAQKQTENRMEELAEAQKRTEIRVEELSLYVKEGFKKMNDRFSTLGSRWGIKNEKTIRNTINALLAKSGYTVTRGYYGDREVDVIIKNGEHILLEITSSALKKDVRNLNNSAEDYQTKVGIEPKLMIAAIYIPPTVMREIVDSPRKIEIFTDEEDEE